MDFSEFQNLIHQLYFKKDLQREALGTFAWLVEEIGEVAEWVKQKEVDPSALGLELSGCHRVDVLSRKYLRD